MRHGIGCNIVIITNQLSFAYQGLALKFHVFVSPPTKSTRMVDFIYVLKEKQKVWHKMMTTSAKSQQYYSLAQRLSPYRLPLPS